jgi:hypothetical protein
LRIDDGPQEPHTTRVHLRSARQSHIDGLSHLQQRQVLLGHLSAKLDFAAFRQAE